MENEAIRRSSLLGEPVTEIAAVGAELSEVVYLDEAELVPILEHHGYVDVEFIRAKRTGTEAVCVRRGDDLFISFRGTKQPVDYVIDLMFVPRYWPLRHWGFGLAWRSVRDDILSWINEQTDADSGRSLHLSGHSLGAAVAVIAAYELYDEVDLESITTFGAPRMFFFASTSAARHRLEPLTRRYVNGSDVIPRVVPALVGYRHVGSMHRAERPDMPSIVAKLNDALAGLSSQGSAHEPESKRLIRWVLGIVMIPGAVIAFVATLAMSGISLMRGGFRAGQSHARVRYLNNLGLVPLRKDPQPSLDPAELAEQLIERLIEQQSPFPSYHETLQLSRARAELKRARSNLEREAAGGSEVKATVVVALIGAVIGWFAGGWSMTLIVAMVVVLGMLTLNLAAWFNRSLDPVGELKAWLGMQPPKSQAEVLGVAPPIDSPDKCSDSPGG